MIELSETLPGAGAWLAGSAGEGLDYSAGGRFA
jgi:hypothetical protein